MYQKPESASVPWEFLGSFLADAKRKIEDELASMPGSRLSYLEVKMFRKMEDETPPEEYNLTVGEAGMQLCPEAEIEEEEVIEQGGQESDLETPPPPESPVDEQKDSRGYSADVSQDSYDPTPAQKLVHRMLFTIRDELAGKPEVDGFSVGVRALVSTNPVECAGFVCEKKIIRLIPLKIGWFLREYYPRASGRCGRRWTNIAC
jgi:hypothetical protein